MTKNRITFFGWTDYSVTTLKEIIYDLENDYLFHTEKAIQNLADLIPKVHDNSKQLEDAEEITGYIAYCIKLFKSFTYDFKRLIKEIPKGVEIRHVDIVTQIYERCCDDEKSQALQFKKEHMLKKQEDESLHFLLSNIYATSREIFIRHKNLGSLRNRLKTFVGTEGSSKDLSVISTSSSSKPELIAPLETPGGAKWQDVRIIFLDHKTVEIRIGEKPFGAIHYGTLGFRDKRQKPKQPDILWGLLFKFGVNEGEISWEEIGHWKKNISRLRNRLKVLFKIDGDPFYPFWKTKSYKTKFSISIRKGMKEEELEARNIDEARLADILKKESLIRKDHLTWTRKQEIEGKDEDLD